AGRLRAVRGAGSGRGLEASRCLRGERGASSRREGPGGALALAAGFGSALLLEAPGAGARGLRERPLEGGEVLLPRPLDGPEAGQVARVDLAVDEGDVPAHELLDEADEGDLRGVGSEGEHRLAE